MYLLSDKLNLDELIGQEINMVCVGPYDAQIKLEKGVTIQSLTKLEGEVNGKRSVWFSGEWIDTSYISKLPKQEIIEISKESSEVLKFTLTNSVAIYIHTEESQYESINITMSDGAVEII